MFTQLKAAATYTEAQLITGLKSGDKAAFTYLYDNYSSALYGVIHRIVQSEEIASDVLQESFLKIWKNIDNYSQDKGSLYTWMLNVCRNTAIDEVRSKSYRRETKNQNIEDFVHAVNRNEQVHTSVDHIGLKEVLDKLKTEHRVLIDKIYFEGYTHEQASQELGMPLGTVKTRIRAAILHLKDIMQVNK